MRWVSGHLPEFRDRPGIDWLVSAVGEDTALAFLESVGGQRIQVPRTAEGSRLATLYGVDVASALSAEYGGLSVEIPVCKKWRILVLAARGLPVNDIATRVGASWRYVRAVIQAGPAHIRVERRRKSSEIPGQLPLFA